MTNEAGWLRLVCKLVVLCAVLCACDQHDDAVLRCPKHSRCGIGAPDGIDASTPDTKRDADVAALADAQAGQHDASTDSGMSSVSDAALDSGHDAALDSGYTDDDASASDDDAGSTLVYDAGDGPFGTACVQSLVCESDCSYAAPTSTSEHGDLCRYDGISVLREGTCGAYRYRMWRNYTTIQKYYRLDTGKLVAYVYDSDGPTYCGGVAFRLIRGDLDVVRDCEAATEVGTNLCPL